MTVHMGAWQSGDAHASFSASFYNSPVASVRHWGIRLQVDQKIYGCDFDQALWGEKPESAESMTAKSEAAMRLIAKSLRADSPAWFAALVDTGWLPSTGMRTQEEVIQDLRASACTALGIEHPHLVNVWPVHRTRCFHVVVDITDESITHDKLARLAASLRTTKVYIRPAKQNQYDPEEIDPATLIAEVVVSDVEFFGNDAP